MTDHDGLFDLSVSRIFDVPAALIFHAWTDPVTLARWWGPAGPQVPQCELDLRLGGKFHPAKLDPEGNVLRYRAVFLEIVENERLVFSDAYIDAWVPSAKPFMTGIITMREVGRNTEYTATARHWSEEDLKTHEDMGFHEHWNETADRLTHVLAQLKRER